MKRTWTYLMQRCGIVESGKYPDKVGFNSRVRLEYMGAFEFEDGSVRKSFTRILKSLDEYEVIELTTSHRNYERTFKVLLKSQDKELVIKDFESIIQGKYRTKEYTNLAYAMAGEPLTNFWWSLDMDYMAWYYPQEDFDLINLLKVDKETYQL